MFLKKISQANDDAVHEKFAYKTKENWKRISQAVLKDKIPEDKLERPVDNNVMDKDDVLESIAKLKKQDAKFIRLRELTQLESDKQKRVQQAFTFGLKLKDGQPDKFKLFNCLSKLSNNYKELGISK